MTEETIKTCFQAGTSFGRVLAGPAVVWTDYPPLGKYTVPASELALFQKAYGANIIAVGCLLEEEKPVWCNVAYEKRGRCGIISGLPGEVLPIEYRKEKGI